MASTCNKSFCSNFMLLNPEEAGFLELFKILFSSEIGKRKFVDCPDGTREPFGRRWIIFVSVLMMKLLKAVAKPMAGFGSGVEYWLNLLSENGGKVIFPDKTSASFLSFIGNIDKRFGLDSSINPGDKRYYAALCVMAAKASYENKNYIESVVRDHWKSNTHVTVKRHLASKLATSSIAWQPSRHTLLACRLHYQEKSTTQAFILEDTKKNTVVIAFRGTEPFDADSWSSDFDISWYELPNIGKIHGGFLKALGLQLSQGWPQSQADDKPITAYYAVRKLLKEHLTKNENAKFIITGHSLGGALAALFPAVLALHEESALLDRIEGVYTFGQPRVGDEEFGEFMKKVMEKHGLKFFRFVYSFDLVPRLPYDDKMLMFKHFGTCIYYNSFYQGRVSYS
ncbi:hypothetical protein DH2020_012368 [Rehmannia glutinosa]|uniref:Fungal lipase-type domain-containing protein n=1 Tax=Rehmannia glutinosa TaxID=99300 RepID=A0ABR0X294_REHGL